MLFAKNDITKQGKKLMKLKDTEAFIEALWQELETLNLPINDQN